MVTYVVVYYNEWFFSALSFDPVRLKPSNACIRRYIPGVLWSSTRVTCEMVSDGDGQFIPAGIVGLHTLSLLFASLVAHDRATEDNHTTHRKGAKRPPMNTTEHYSWVQ